MCALDTIGFIPHWRKGNYDEVCQPSSKFSLRMWLVKPTLSAHRTNVATTSLTLVGHAADSPGPPLRPSPAMGHAAEILDR
jgi:hypothetical protein